MRWGVIRFRAGILLACALWAGALLVGYWALGGTWGLTEMIGDPSFRPPPLLMWVTAFLLAGWVMVVFGAMRMWGGDGVNRFCRLGCCLIAMSLLGVGSMFYRSDSEVERMVFAPLVLLLAVVAAVLVRGEPQTRRLFPW